ncbi:MAG: tRNA guanosine(15) transglycosylase TgtA [Methanobacteriota archaeon]
MPFTFEILARDGGGRLGRIETRHGALATPALLPVVNPNLPLITPREMRERFGVAGVITNAYIVHRHEDLRNRALAEGIHRLLDFDGVVMMDSGTFQSYFYAKDIGADPVGIVKFQRDVGADIGTILDLFTEPDEPETKARADIEETLARASRSVPVKGDLALACTVQGGRFPRLREFAARSYWDVAADVHPVGGVVPIMERQDYATLAEVVLAAKKALPPERPVHLFGAGHPHMFAFSALLGCDLFDSASWAKFAADGRFFVPEGTLHLSEVDEFPCPCPMCTAHAPDDLRRSPKERQARLLAEHNLWVAMAEMRRVRDAIRRGALWELVQTRARSHPALREALRVLSRHGDWLASQDAASKPTAFFHVGPEALYRSEAVRLRRRILARYVPRASRLVLLPDARKPYSETYAAWRDVAARGAAVVAVETVFGPAPLELDAVYPISPSVVPEVLPPDEAEAVRGFSEEFAKAKSLSFERVRGTGDEVRGSAEASPVPRSPSPVPRSPSPVPDFDRLRLASTLDLSFGPGASGILSGDLQLVRSPNTGKVRNVFVDGEHLFSMRAEDGLPSLKAAGGERLRRTLPAPRARIVVDDDAAPFLREGKNLFAKFVRSVDPEILPGDEALLVAGDDELAAVAKTVLSGPEMRRFPTGVAAKTREGRSI